MGPIGVRARREFVGARPRTPTSAPVPEIKHSSKPVSSSGMMRRSITSMPRRLARSFSVRRVIPRRGVDYALRGEENIGAAAFGGPPQPIEHRHQKSRRASRRTVSSPRWNHKGHEFARFLEAPSSQPRSRSGSSELRPSVAITGLCIGLAAASLRAAQSQQQGGDVPGAVDSIGGVWITRVLAKLRRIIVLGHVGIG
jgi:hypothetical protein